MSSFKLSPLAGSKSSSTEGLPSPALAGALSRRTEEGHVLSALPHPTGEGEALSGSLAHRTGEGRGEGPSPFSRRRLLTIAAASYLAAMTSCVHRPGRAVRRPGRLCFTSAGKTCLIDADGSGFRVLEFNAPGQATWQAAGFFPDGRILLLSMEPRRDGPGRPFDQYYHLTPTHLWAFNLERNTLTELATRERLAPFYTPQLILPDERVLVQVIRSRPGQIMNMKLDGTDAREFTRADEGLPYGLSLSPDGLRVAFHLASPQGYQIWTSDLWGGARCRVAAHPDHLYFGPSWSPDGQWLAFQDCHFRSDPGHDWSDLCLSRPDGTSQRLLTTGQAMWFGATYGSPRHRGGGSNLAAWTRNGRILFPQRLQGASVPWVFQEKRPDTDHFNREYQPHLARGGTQICRLDPSTGMVEPLTSPGPGVWDFRCCESPDGSKIAFCRAQTGGVPGLWVMNADGSEPRLLSLGLDEQGADHPRWIPGT